MRRRFALAALGACLWMLTILAVSIVEASSTFDVSGNWSCTRGGFCGGSAGAWTVTSPEGYKTGPLTLTEQNAYLEVIIAADAYIDVWADANPANGGGMYHANLGDGVHTVWDLYPTAGQYTFQFLGAWGTQTFGSATCHGCDWGWVPYYGQATATPAPSSTPNVTPTPSCPFPQNIIGCGGTPTPIAGGAAATRVAITTGSTVYSGISSGVIPVVTSGADNTSTMNGIVITSGTLNVCLPSEIGQVFGNVSLCLSIPTLQFAQFKLLGIDLMPSFALMAGVVFFLFLIRRLAAK